MVDTQRTLNNEITGKDLKHIGVQLEDDEYDPQHHRGYASMNHPEAENNMQRTFWKGILEKDAFLPYFCPCGWHRFAVIVPEQFQFRNNPEFWANSSNMYHGLEPENVHHIVRGGFKPNLCQHGGQAVYLTPSIRYAAHPRYARVQVVHGRYFQVVLQCRVLNAKLTKFKEAVANGGVSDAQTGETMNVSDAVRIDQNVENNVMEFLWMADTVVKSEHGIVVTGIMVRCLSENPIDAPENSWWSHWKGLDFLRKHYTVDKTGSSLSPLPASKKKDKTGAHESDSEPDRQERNAHDPSYPSSITGMVSRICGCRCNDQASYKLLRGESADGTVTQVAKASAICCCIFIVIVILVAVHHAMTACKLDCNTCSSGSACTECKNSKYLSNGYCVTSCPTGFYLSGSRTKGRSCKACKPYCNTCTSGSACTECMNSMYLSKGDCVTSCPTGFYAYGSGAKGRSCKVESTKFLKRNRTSSTKKASTTLASQANAGDTKLAVASVANFQVGEGVIIDAGTTVEETNVITGFSSILVKTPLQYKHSAGAIVSVTQAATTTAGATTTATTAAVPATTAAVVNSCPRLYPKCLRPDYDCVISTCADGASCVWVPAPKPGTDPGDTYTYIDGYDASGSSCMQDFQAATCPQLYPICSSDKDCVTTGAQPPWIRAGTPQTAPGAGYNYIDGYDGLGSKCLGNHIATATTTTTTKTITTSITTAVATTKTTTTSRTTTTATSTTTTTSSTSTASTATTATATTTTSPTTASTTMTSSTTTTTQATTTPVPTTTPMATTTKVPTTTPKATTTKVPTTTPMAATTRVPTTTPTATTTKVPTTTPMATTTIVPTGVEPSKTVTAKFQPGTLGISIGGKNGDEVKAVTPGGQAASQGIERGMQITLIDGRPFRANLLKQKRMGSHMFELTLVETTTTPVPTTTPMAITTKVPTTTSTATTTKVPTTTPMATTTTVATGVEPSKTVTAKFQPGTLGISIGGKNGDEVKTVTPGGQAASQGIQIGMKMTLIDGRPFSATLLRQKRMGSHMFELTLVETTTTTVPTTTPMATTTKVPTTTPMATTTKVPTTTPMATTTTVPMGVEPSKTVAAKFQPGTLGISIGGKNGDEVKTVTPGGQAASQGIERGMKMILIDGRPYSLTLFKQKATGSQIFELTFVPHGGSIT